MRACALRARAAIQGARLSTFVIAPHLPLALRAHSFTPPQHYVFNSEEDDRSGMSANVGNRAAKELYYKPFQVRPQFWCCVAAAARGVTHAALCSILP